MQVAIDSGNRGFLTYEGDPLDENLQLPDAPVGMLIMSYRNRRRYRFVVVVVAVIGCCFWSLVFCCSFVAAAFFHAAYCSFLRDLSHQSGTAFVLVGFTYYQAA